MGLRTKRNDYGKLYKRKGKPYEGIVFFHALCLIFSLTLHYRKRKGGYIP
jgi:hypothetical protein